MFRIPTEFLILGAAQYIDHIQNRTKNSSSQKSAFAMKSEKENRFEEKLFFSFENCFAEDTAKLQKRK